MNIFQIGLHDLRKKIAIIPQVLFAHSSFKRLENEQRFEIFNIQEPAIFTGNMRFNLDPFHEFADQILLGALSIVDLEVGKKGKL